MKNTTWKPHLLALSILGAGSLASDAAINSVTSFNNAGGSFAYQSSLSTAGTLVDAVNFGTSANIVANGITFTGNASGNPSGANYAVTGAASVDNGLSNPGIDDLFFTEAWGNATVPTLTVSNLNPGSTYLIQILHGEPRSCCTATWTGNTVATNVDAAQNVPSFNIGNGVNGQNPPGANDIAIVTAEVTGVTSFTYAATGGNGRGGSLAGFQTRLIPEPSALGLVGLTLGTLMFRRRRTLRR